MTDNKTLIKAARELEGQTGHSISLDTALQVISNQFLFSNLRSDIRELILGLNAINHTLNVISINEAGKSLADILTEIDLTIYNSGD